jgi:hypothetical protein
MYSTHISVSATASIHSTSHVTVSTATVLIVHLYPWYPYLAFIIHLHASRSWFLRYISMSITASTYSTCPCQPQQVFTGHLYVSLSQPIQHTYLNVGPSTYSTSPYQTQLVFIVHLYVSYS